MSDSKRRLAAIMSADVAGYSRLMGDDERATVDTLNAYRDVFRTSIAAHDGRVVDTAGDSVLAMFDSVVEAVESAAEVQAALAERNAALPEQRRMMFRIGVNLGDVITQADGTIYGDGVNVAARLEQLAEPGTICVSESAHMQADGKLPLAFEDIGTHTVKNIDKPVRVFRVDAAAGTVPSKTTGAVTHPEKPSIAVLPLDNLSGDTEQDYFADGLTEDVITALSHFRELFVIARNTTFAYKGASPNIQELGGELGVQYVLEGSVRRAGNRLRLNAQLIETAGGSHVWAQRYDRELTDIFEVQDELTASIVGALGVALRGEALDRARAKAPDQLNAYDLVLRVTQGIFTGYSPEKHAECRDWAEQAVDLSPDYARAHAVLALVYLDEFRWKFNPVPERPEPLTNARQEAQTAVELDPTDALSHYVMGKVLFFAREFERYGESFERALQLNQNYADAMAEFAIRLAIRGDTARARDMVATAMRLNPNTPAWYHWANVTIGLGEQDYEMTISAVKDVAMPGVWVSHAAATVAFAFMGRMDEAKSALADLLRCFPGFADDPKGHLLALGYPDEEVTRRIAAYRELGLAIPEAPG